MPIEPVFGLLGLFGLAQALFLGSSKLRRIFVRLISAQLAVFLLDKSAKIDYLCHILLQFNLQMCSGCTCQFSW